MPREEQGQGQGAAWEELAGLARTLNLRPSRRRGPVWDPSFPGLEPLSRV